VVKKGVEVMNSDEIVEKIQKFGSVDVFQDERDKTFSAVIELKVTGMDAKVKSGYNHPTMLAALEALDQKLNAVIITMGSISSEQPLLNEL
jgi:Zn-dependent alcohol dehydrogenase